MKIEISEEKRNIIKTAIEKFGTPNQIGMLMEEVGELLTAINQHGRRRVTDEAVTEEIADVMIMLVQMSVIFGEEDVQEWIDKKIKRLEERILSGHPERRQ